MSTQAESAARDALLARLGGTERLIIPGTIASVGRARESNLRSNHEQVSRHHARLAHDGEGWWFIDADSLNGSYLDSVVIERLRIDGAASIRLGDRRTGPILELRTVRRPTERFADVRGEAGAAP